MKELDFHFLATSSTIEERSALTDDFLKSAHNSHIATLRELLDRELHMATLAALQVADMYWNYVKVLQSEQDEKEQATYFTVRVRLDEARRSLTIAWQKRYPIKGGKSGRTSNSRHIPKGSSSTFRYSRNAFGQIRDWEYEAIEAAEVRFEKIRRQVDAIAKMRRNLTSYERLINR